MSKKDKVKNDKIESNGKVSEAVEVLRVQLQEHLQKSEYHKTMATKAQGALEVMLQLIPKEEIEKMMVQEAKDNRENGEVVEG